jgi:hypothetical protein
MQIEQKHGDQMVCLAAFRYALGRRSYFGESYREWLRAHWDQFTAETRQTMLRDLVEYLMWELSQLTTDEQTLEKHNLVAWTELGEWMWTSLPEHSRRWVMQDTAWRELPWPLSGGDPFFGTPETPNLSKGKKP